MRNTLLNKIKKNIIFFLLFFLFISLSPSYSQKPLISEIDIEGNITVDRSLIINMSGLTRGMEIDTYLLQDVIKRIHNMGYFSDVQIKGEETIDGKKLIIVVREYPKLEEIQIKGNKKIKSEDIKEKLRVYEGQMISPSQIKEEVKNIKSLYEEKGYLLAIIESEVLGTEKEGEVILKFNIDEGKKVKIKKIEIEGNKVFSDGKIKKQMKNKQDSFFRSGSFNSEEYEKDKERVVQFYKKKGYLDADITSDSIWYSPSKKKMYIKLQIYEGDKYHFGEVSFSENVLFSFDELKDQLEFETGEVYNQEKFDKSLAGLHSIYMEEGYIYVRVLDNISTKGSRVDIRYQITEGAPARVHKIDIEGNTKTKEKVIRRELFIKPGQIFRRSLLMRSLRDVTYLNYFSNVIPDYRVLENGDIDLIIKVEEKPTGQVSFGAGYSERDKLIGTIGLGTPNLFGNGQQLQLNWDFGKRKNSIQLSFTEPWFRDTPTSVGFDIYNLNRRWYTDFTEGRRGLSFRLGRRLTWPDNYFTIFCRYRIEDVKYYDFQTYDGNVVKEWRHLAEIKWPQRTSSFDFTIQRDSRDLPQFATSGSKVFWRAEFAGGILGGDWSYHKHIFEASKFIKTLWKFVLAIKGRVGIIDAYSLDTKIPYIHTTPELLPRGHTLEYPFKEVIVPYSERFSPGGVDPDGVIRGYPDGTIGPMGPLGYRIRGRSVLVYNIEYQFPIVEQQIYALLLADLGNAWLTGRQIQPFAFKNLYKSLGFGVRLVVPGMGIIGFDMVYGFDYNSLGEPDVKERDHGEWRPHFNFGTTF